MKTGIFEKAHDCTIAARNGKITVDDKLIYNANYFVNPKKSIVKFKGEILRLVKRLYFALNKPADYICQKSKKEKSIYDLLESLNLPEELIKSLFAVGRLDKGTEGLIIITNDGKLSNLLLSPNKEITKEYYAVLQKTIDINKIKQLEYGIEINVDYKKYQTKPSKIKIVGEKESYISILEGKKRQIRKMFEAVGNKVVYLKRVSIGNLKLGNLESGEFKEISREEIYKSIMKNQFPKN